MTFAEWLTAVANSWTNARRVNNLTRVGQHYFNSLGFHRPDIAEVVRGSTFDPFYNDNNLPAFFDEVQLRW